ncbi:MAG TPA: hypothetical protein VFE07_00170 [Marmoricola sp.]|nr:hypothetical protein [Marmoricola sp.]
MEILLWLLPSVVVTCAAMAWISWVARDRPDRGRTAAEQAAFEQALLRPLPDDQRRARPREHSSGVAQVRPETRRSA